MSVEKTTTVAEQIYEAGYGGLGADNKDTNVPLSTRSLSLKLAFKY